MTLKWEMIEQLPEFQNAPVEKQRRAKDVYSKFYMKDAPEPERRNFVTGGLEALQQGIDDRSLLEKAADKLSGLLGFEEPLRRSQSDEGAKARATVELQAKEEGIPVSEYREGPRLIEQFAGGMTNAMGLGLPNAVRRAVLGENMNFAPSSSGEQIAGGIGELAGFIGGAAGGVTGAVGQQIASRLPQASSLAGRAAGGIMAQAPALGAGFATRQVGEAIQEKSLADAAESMGKGTAEGVITGTIFGGAGAIPNRIARIATGLVALEAQKQTGPNSGIFDDRPISEKAYDIAQNIYFLWKGHGPKVLNRMEAEMNKPEAERKSAQEILQIGFEPQEVKQAEPKAAPQEPQAPRQIEAPVKQKPDQSSLWAYEDEASLVDKLPDSERELDGRAPIWLDYDRARLENNRTAPDATTPRGQGAEVVEQGRRWQDREVDPVMDTETPAESWVDKVRNRVDQKLLDKKTSIEKRISKLDDAITSSNETDMPGAYVTGASGIPRSRIKKIDQQLDRRIDRAKEQIKLSRDLANINAKIKGQELRPSREKEKANYEEYATKQLESIEVGDKIDIGGNDLLTVIKKNAKSVVTEGGSKWKATEIGKVIKANVPEVPEIGNTRTAPEATTPRGEGAAEQEQAGRWAEREMEPLPDDSPGWADKELSNAKTERPEASFKETTKKDWEQRHEYYGQGRNTVPERSSDPYTSEKTQAWINEQKRLEAEKRARFEPLTKMNLRELKKIAAAEGAKPVPNLIEKFGYAYGIDHARQVKAALGSGELTPERYAEVHEKTYGPIEEFYQPEPAKAEPPAPQSKKEKSIAEYNAYVASLDDAQRAQAGDLIKDNPWNPGLAKRAIEKVLAGKVATAPTVQKVEAEPEPKPAPTPNPARTAIKKIVEENERENDIAIRVIPKGYEVKVGDTLKKSYVWKDGNKTRKRLNGTSGIGITSKDFDWALKQLHNPPYNQYHGDQIAVIAGYPHELGNDVGEYIIPDAKVIGVFWKKDVYPDTSVHKTGEEIPPSETAKPNLDRMRANAEALKARAEAKFSQDRQAKAKKKDGGGTTLYSGIPIHEAWELLKKFTDKFYVGVKEQDATLYRQLAGLPSWTAKKYPKEFGPLFDIVNERQLNKTIIRNGYLKDLLPAWKDLTAEETKKVGDILWRGDKLGKVLNEKGLAKLSPAARRAYEATREVLDYIWKEDRIMTYRELFPEESESEIQEMRNLAGEVTGYMPHDRKGKWFISAKNRDGEKLWNQHFDDITRTMTRGNYGIKTKMIEKKVRKMFPDASDIFHGKVTRAFAEDGYFDVSPQITEELINAAMKRVKGDDISKEDFDKALKKAVAEVFMARGFMSHGIQRSGVEGFDKSNWQQSVLDYVSGWAGYKSKMIAAQKVGKKWGGIDWTGKEGLRQYADKYIRDAFRNEDNLDRLSAKVRSALFFKFLGGVVKSAVVNLTQTPAAFWPRFSVETKWSSVKIAEEAGKASADVLKALYTEPEGGASRRETAQAKRLSEEERRGITKARQDGTINDQLTEELMGDLPGKYGSVVRGVADVMKWLFGKAEIFNREVAYLTSFRAGKERGYTFEKADKFARDMIRESHFQYGKFNLPPFARGQGKAPKLARAAYTFRSYSHNMIEMYMSLATDHSTAGKVAILKSLGAIALIGGIGSLPFFETIEEEYHRLTGKNIRSEIKKKWGEWATYINYGVPGLFGVDLSTSLGQDVPKSAIEILGAPTAFWQETANMVDDIKKGDTYRAIEDAPVMPSAIRNVMKANRLGDRGLETRGGKPILDSDFEPVKLNKAEQVGQAMGFQPARVSEEYRQSRAQQVERDMWDKKKRLLGDRYRIADKNGNTDKILDEISEFNEKRPDYIAPVTVKTIRQWIIDKPSKREVLIEEGIQ